MQLLKCSTLKKYNQWVLDIHSGTYRPFLTVRAVNKFGRRHWIWCDKQQREVHLLSDAERRAYEIMISRPTTVEVKEQYALDFSETLSIANELGYVHPRNYKTKQIIVMTTDFITVSQSLVNQKLLLKAKAYTFKYSSDLYTDKSCSAFLPSATRTIQKLEIEQEYWNRRGIEYRVITELHATKERAWNIQFCKNSFKGVADKSLAMEFPSVFYDIWEKNRYAHLSDLFIQSATILAIGQDDAEQLFCFCVLHDLVKLVHSSKLQKYRPIELE
ncbi:TnsA endonuclease N-terminal domain-containing protein [Rheinheimera muenzenbergensis]|uniref:TnsA endonuclease N-terminal domain-containing protein n=1 Tax=Rheinheimera muenzenbergensis TaxID=1193628 RepID=A0ABU8C2A9_9GAMM